MLRSLKVRPLVSSSCSTLCSMLLHGNTLPYVQWSIMHILQYTQHAHAVCDLGEVGRYITPRPRDGLAVSTHGDAMT